MSHPGFHLIELRLTGKEVQDAEVQFKKGLNVVCGPSNTGKTFIFQCINYIFGAKDKPKNIGEAGSYDTIILTIETYQDGKRYTLKRSLRGGAIEASTEGSGSFILKANHNKDAKDTISYFLLELLGLENRWIRKNKNGEKQSLSFRNIVHLCLIAEDQIIKEISPALTGHRISQPAELSVFRLLLTGVDDSSVIGKSTDKTSKIRVESKNELLQELIEKVAAKYDDLKVVGSYEELLEQAASLEQSHDRASEALDVAQEQVAEMETARSASWNQLRQTESRLRVLSELGSRFSVLEQQYVSDLRRLEAIAETGRRLTEMSLERCLVCGASPEYHNSEHLDALVTPDTVAKSCVAESVKLRSLLADLKTTQADVKNELNDKLRLKQSLESTLQSARRNIQESLKPQLKKMLTEYREREEKMASVKIALELQNRLREYEGLVEEIARQEKSEIAVSGDNSLLAKGIKDFSLEVENRLRTWNYLKTGQVDFNESDWDIIISGQGRATNGKGVHAITHAAFSLGILSYCMKKRMPHPNFLILDSPLTVYKEGKDKTIALDVKDSFYIDIASSFSDVQVIILENEAPPAQLIGSNGFNLIAFTKTTEGRYGFIPVPENKTA